MTRTIVTAGLAGAFALSAAACSSDDTDEPDDPAEDIVDVDDGGTEVEVEDDGIVVEEAPELDEVDDIDNEVVDESEEL